LAPQFCTKTDGTVAPAGASRLWGGPPEVAISEPSLFCVAVFSQASTVDPFGVCGIAALSCQARVIGLPVQFGVLTCAPMMENLVG